MAGRRQRRRQPRSEAERARRARLPAQGAQPDNALAQTHGASSRLVLAYVPELSESVYAENTHLSPERDGPAVARYVEVFARRARALDWAEQQADPLFADLKSGSVHSVLAWVERWETRLAELERQLALTPATRIQLGIATAQAFDLAAHWAQQDEDTIESEADDG